MSGTASIGGLASGLDTATIVEQLMQLEAAPQSRLKARASREQLQVNALQTLNAKVASLATLARDLAVPTAWSAFTATSSSQAVTVAAGAGAMAGSFSVRVDQTAQAHRLEHATSVGLDTSGTMPTSVRVDRLDGTTAQELTTDGTLRGLVAAINDPVNATGLRATAVRVGTDAYRLVVEAATTGAEGDFTLTDASDGSSLLGGATVRIGRDAQVTVGDSIVARSSTNTFADLAPGVTLTLGAGASGTTEISVDSDPGAIAAKVTSLVDAVNGVLAEVGTLTAYNPTSKTGGLLVGDATLRDLRDSVLASVFPGDGSTLADLGIQTDRSGRLVLDEEVLRAAYAADPADVAARMTATGTGFADRVASVAEVASDKFTGSLTTAITGHNASIARLGDGVEAWDTRLELRRTMLTRQFTALETALSRMSSQSSWLAGQISSLSTSGS